MFELINASEMPAAKRFKAWNNNELLPTLCQEGEYSMAKDAPADIAHGMNAVHAATNENSIFVIKVQFANADLEVISVKDKDGQSWMLANPFAKILEYSVLNKAIWSHVSEENKKNLDDLQPFRIGMVTSSLHPHSKFINRAGLFELIQASRMPKAQDFKKWINSDLLPKLCDEGKYDMAVDASVDIAQGMNAVHVATNDSKEAPWVKDLQVFKEIIVEKDKKLTI